MPPESNSAFMQDAPTTDSDGDNDGDHSSVIVHVPAEDLAEGGVPPEEGDEVNFDVKGKIRYVEGSIACVTVTEINGQPVSETQEGEGQDQGENPEEEQLKQAVNSAGSQGGPGAY